MKVYIEVTELPDGYSNENYHGTYEFPEGADDPAAVAQYFEQTARQGIYEIADKFMKSGEQPNEPGENSDPNEHENGGNASEVTELSKGTLDGGVKHNNADQGNKSDSEEHDGSEGDESEGSDDDEHEGDEHEGDGSESESEHDGSSDDPNQSGDSENQLPPQTSSPNAPAATKSKAAKKAASRPPATKE